MSIPSVCGNEVDIWFCYGSFFYGFEGTVSGVPGSGLEVTLPTHSSEESEHLQKFLGMVLQNVSRLIRIEVRVYQNDAVVTTQNSSYLQLFTELPPQILEQSQNETLLFFENLFSTNEVDRDKWHNFCQLIDESNMM